MKKLSDTYKELGIEFEFPIEIRDSNEYMTYYEASTGFWYKKEYDADGNMTYHENSYGTKNRTPRSAKTGQWYKYEFDKILTNEYFILVFFSITN